MRRRQISLSALQLGVVCFSTTVLVFLGELRFLMAPENRFYQFWQRSDAVVLSLMIVTIAMAATGVALWARATSPRLSAVLRGMLVLALFEALLAVVVRLSLEPPFWVTWLFPVGAFALAAGVHVARPGLLYRASVIAALVLSPLGPILLAQLLSAPSVDLREQASGPSMPPGDGPPIVLLIFDEWSYSRSTRADRFIASMPRLTRVADGADFFTAAHSPAGTTFHSLRAILAESQRGTEVRSAHWWYDDVAAAEEPLPPRLFLRAQRAGYRSEIIGYYLPYRELVGEAASVVLTEPYFPKGHDVIAQMGWIGLRVLTFQGDPFTRFLATRVDQRLFNRYWYDLNLRVEARLARALRDIEPGAFVVGHLPLPHAPFVFSAEGRYQPDSVGSRLEFAPAKYADHLAYVDQVAGRLLDSLRASGQYDSSLVIITSDHSWKVDTLAHGLPGAEAMTHVPLIVRWPGQREGKVVRDPVCLVGLGALVSRVRDSSATLLPRANELHDAERRPCPDKRASNYQIQSN